MNGFRYAGNLAFYLSLCCAMFLSPPLAAEPQIAPGNPELIVLLPAGGDPVAVADAINAPSPLVPIPYGLETGNPVQAEILIEERPEGVTLQWALANRAPTQHVTGRSFAYTTSVAGIEFLLSFSALHAAEAATFQVTKTVDEVGTCDSGDCALREAVLAANASPGGDIIEVPSALRGYVLPSRPASLPRLPRIASAAPC